MEAIGTLVSYLASTGPVGAIVAALVVALVLAVVILAWAARTLLGHRTDEQFAAFQARLLDAVGALGRIEERHAAENVRLREELARQGAMIELLREQQRRAIDLLRRVAGGKVAPADITEADLREEI